jgi:asparagine synthase (glutamine-hydrolysing)
VAGVRDAHPFLDVDLIETVLGLPPELAFDARFDRALLRDATRGVLPDQVRLRRDKVFFNSLLQDALTGSDREAIHRTLTGAALELGDLVDRQCLERLWERGPGDCPRGPSAWATEIWRAFSLEAWLRREAGCDDG